MIRRFVITVFASVLLVAVSALNAGAEESHFYVNGAGDVPLAVTTAGNPAGPEILLIHGLGHGRESFRFQLQSELTETFRIVAFDLRGHGQSGKPWTTDGYAEPAIWAQDVLSVMDAAALKKPVVVGWSYGGLVAADLVRQTGSERLSGLVLVSSLAGLVRYTPDFSKGGAEMAEAYRLFAQPSFENQSRAVGIVAPFLVSKAPDAPWPESVIQLGMMLPPYVRPLLASHKTDNLDLVEQFNFPVLILHGKQDAAIPGSAVDALVAALPQAKSIGLDNNGHSPFAEQPAQFNKQLSEFTKAVWKGHK